MGAHLAIRFFARRGGGSAPALLNADHLSFSAPSQYARALAAFVLGKGDFADYVIREHGLAAGCTVVVTFDQALLKETGYRSP
jgi:predicted nucleic-acid-binding protein